MKRIYILVFFLITISCSLERGAGGSFLITNIGEELVDYDTYGVKDKEIATKICYAFQSKRSNFFSDQAGKIFKFDVRVVNNSCKVGLISKMIDTTLIARSLSEPMFFDSLTPLNEFEPYLQTNAYGYLAVICERIMRGEEMPPVTTEYGADKRTQIGFYENQEDVGFIFRSYNRDWESSEESYILSEYDYLSILVDPAQEMYGIVIERVREKKCETEMTERKSQLYLP